MTVEQKIERMTKIETAAIELQAKLDTRKQNRGRAIGS